MSNWQERLRQLVTNENRSALEKEVALQNLAAAEAKRKALEAAKAEDASLAIEEELWKLFESLGVGELLKGVRNEVWKAGEVDVKPTLVQKVGEPYVFQSLKFSYKTAGPEYRQREDLGRSVDPGLDSRSYFTGRYKITTETLRLAVAVGYSDGVFKLMTSDSSSKISDTGWMERWEHVTTEVSRGTLEELLVKDSLERVRSNSLPVQLKAYGERQIAEKVYGRRT